MNYVDNILKRLMAMLASRSFFWCIVALLVVQAAWIALTSHYPMAFDEDFHLGIIRIYAHHLSPFLSGQPAGADAYGAVARDPSYLYHYLFSYPYRLINLFTHSQDTQVIILRFLNIGLFAGGLVLYRRLLGKLKAPAGVINGSLLFFVLIPVVPLLAAQINYDNLFIPAIAVDLLLTHKLVSQLRAKKRFDVVTFLWLLIAVMLTSLVKYAFLPIFVAIMAFVLVETIRTAGRSITRPVMDWRLVGTVALIIVSIGLFSQRYGVNLVRYHQPIPECSKVLSVKQCSGYGPWIRDYNFAINKVDEAHNPAVFTGDWFFGMWLRLYFAVDGPATLYQTRGPLPVPGISGVVIGVGGLLALGFGLRGLPKRYDRNAVILFISTAGVYIATLWFDNYRAYVRTGQPVAINGRYLLPFLPLLLVLGTLAGRQMLLKHPRISGLLVAIILFSQVWGGGVLTYILRSNDSWYRSGNAVRDANHAVQHLLGPVTPGYNEPAEFL